MSSRREIKFFSAGSELCQERVRPVPDIVCSDYDGELLDLNGQEGVQKARHCGIVLLQRLSWMVNSLSVESNAVRARHFYGQTGLERQEKKSHDEKRSVCPFTSIHASYL